MTMLWQARVMHEHRDPNDELMHSGEEFKGRGEGISPTLIGLVLLAVASVIFIVQNSDRSKVRFLFFTVTTRVWVGVVVAIALGVVLDRLFSIWWRRRKERE
jgi:uncharacterized integral membrane protein